MDLTEILRKVCWSKVTFNDFRILLYGVKQFNLHPERGLKYLEENGFLENTPPSLAKFLFRQERLSKKQIGELRVFIVLWRQIVIVECLGKYLGSHQEFNKEVLVQFVRCHEFTQLLLVQALRQFLWSFRYVIGRKSPIEPIFMSNLHRFENS